jgi:hypothetical protein
MHNPIIATAPFGPVYRRKINVYFKNEITENEWRYCYSTNAYRTCRDAIIAAAPSFPNSEVRANFAKDKS